jgi:hypothetical protein
MYTNLKNLFLEVIMYMVKIVKMGYDRELTYGFPLVERCCHCSNNARLSTVALNNIDDYDLMDPTIYEIEKCPDFDLDEYGGVLPFDVFACGIYICSDCAELTYIFFIDALGKEEEGPPPFRILRKEDLN